MDIYQCFDQIIACLTQNEPPLSALAAIVAIIGALSGAIWFLPNRRKKEVAPSNTQSTTTNFSSSGNNTVQINATHGATVNDVHVGDVHHHGLSVEDALKLAEGFAAEAREKDKLVIRSLEKAIQAVTQQNSEKYNIQQAVDLLKQGNAVEAESIFEQIADEAQQKGIEANLKQAEALRHLGALAFLHDTQKALSAYQRSTILDPRNPEGWNQLGNLYLRIGELEKAENAYQALLKIDDSSSIYQAVVLCNLGIIYQTRGDLDRAIDYHEKALKLNQELGNKEGIAINNGNLGIVYGKQGNFPYAMRYINESIALYQEIDHKEGIAASYDNLGIVYRMQGDLKCAMHYHQEALDLNEEIGNKEGTAGSYDNVGKIYKEQGNLGSAIECYEKALALYKEIGHKLGIACSYGNLGNVYKQSNLDHAIDYWKESLALFTQIGAKLEMTKIQALLDKVQPKQSD